MKKKNTLESSFLGAMQAELLAQMRVLEARREALVAGGFDKDLVNSAAALGRVLIGLASEIRQQEKHVKQIVDRMTPDELDAVLRQHIADLPRDRQAAFKAFFDELAGAGSVL